MNMCSLVPPQTKIIGYCDLYLRILTSISPNFSDFITHNAEMYGNEVELKVLYSSTKMLYL